MIGSTARTILSAADFGVELTVWSKDFERLDQVHHFESLDATSRHLARGALEFTVEDGEDVNDALRLPGARVCLKLDGEAFLSGPVEERGGSLVRGGLRRYTISDDWGVLDNLAYVTPGGERRPTSLDQLGQAVATGPLRSGTVEGQSGYYAWPAGIDAEAATHRLLRENLAERLRLPVVFAAELGRGGQVQLPGVRFGTLEEYAVRILGAAGLGLRVRHDPDLGPWLHIEVTEPAEYEQLLDDESGVIVDGAWVIRAPKTTRALILASGEEAARDIEEYADRALEGEWGLVRETTKDSTGSSPEFPEGLADEFKVPKYFELRDDSDPAEVAKYRLSRDTAGQQLLDDGRPTAGIDAKLAEDGDFYLGAGGFQVGDLVRISAGGEPIRDRITEARLLIDSGGREVTPIVGGYTDDPQRETRDAIDRLAADNARRGRR